jgi:uncharacterized membrane protein
MSIDQAARLEFREELKEVEESRKQRLLHLFFKVSVIVKGIDGLLEIIGGVLLFFVNPAQLHHIVRVLTQHELVEDPHDVVANYLLKATQHLSSDVQIFIALYLLWHGAVKAGLVAALLLKKRWAYPVAIAAFLLFLIYQMYRYLLTYQIGLLLLSGLDIVVIVLTWLEYRRLRASHIF